MLNLSIADRLRSPLVAIFHGGTRLAAVLTALLVSAFPSFGQTYTSPNNGTFTNPYVWNFGAGTFGTWNIPVSDPSLALTIQAYGTGTLAAANDLNLTLNTLNLLTNASSGATLSNTLSGDYAFTGAGKINLLGSGATTTLSAPIVFGSGLTSLTLDGAGASGITISGGISSNSATGAPLTISTDARNSGTGVVTLSGANTFAGGVVLNSGTLSVNNANALGDIANTLTINGGALRSGSTVTIANNITLNTALNYNGALALILGGVVSGGADVEVRTSASGTNGMVLTGINSYTGATRVGSSNFAQAAVDGAGVLQISGAVGSILTTSGISVDSGAALFVQNTSGTSGTNTRVSTSTAISTQSGFLHIFGAGGLLTQSLGTVNAGGLTQIVASTQATTTGTEVTIANLARSGSGTVVFQGANLGGLAVTTGMAAAQGNIKLTQISGAAPSAALVGGGGAAGTTTISILPWALGDVTTTQQLYSAGTGFVTYGANGVRLLSTTTEYNTTNNVNTAGATENVRITGAITSHTTAKSVNSLFFANTGQTLAGGANVLTITSGALASNVAAATISNPVNFGASGAGEAVISVVGSLITTNNLTLSGGFTAASLVKSGHGDLTISTTNPAISGGITINGGEIVVDAVGRLGGATSINVNGSSQAANRAGLNFTHASGTQTLGTAIVSNAATTSISVANAATLQLNSNISGAGGVTYNTANASGIIAVGGTNSYTGPTFIAGSGTVQIDGDARFGSSSDPLASFVSLGGGTLQLTGNWSSSRAVAVTGATIVDTQANNASLSGSFTGNSGLTKLGAGTLTFTGTGTSGLDNDYSGTTTLGNATTQGGMLAISNAGALNAASIAFGPAAAGVAGTYKFDISAATDIDPTDGSSTPWRSVNALSTSSGFTQSHTVQLGSTALAPVDLRVASGTFGGTAGVIAGFGKLVKVGTGTLTLNSATASTFTGGVEIQGGIINFTADNQLGGSGNSVTVKGGTLQLGLNSSLAFSHNLIFDGTQQPIISGSSVQILSNGINVNGGSGNLTVANVISGTGGFNMSGNGFLTFTGTNPNTYQGDSQFGTTNSSGFSFTDNAQLGAASSRLRFNGGTVAFDAAPGVATTYTLPRTIFITAASAGILVVSNANATLDLTGPLLAAFGNLTYVKGGPGTLSISNSNPLFFGNIQLGFNSAEGPIVLTSTGQLRRASILLTNNSGTFNMSGLTRELGSLGNATGNTFGSGSFVALGTGGALTTGFSNLAMTWAGSITGNSTASVTKVGTAALTIQSNGNTFGGGFHVLSGTGGTTLSSNGTLPSQSAFTLGAWGNFSNAGPTFTLSNTATNLGTRLADAQVIHSNAAEFVFTTNTTTATSETVGSLRGAGMSTVTMTTGGTLSFADSTNGLKRINGGTYLFRAGNANMGSAAATTAIANLTFGNSTDITTNQLIGGGGGAGTTTISILPYAVGGITTSDTGSNFVTYGANGIRVLNTTTEVSAQTNVASIAGASSTNNVRFTNSSLTTTQITGSTNLTYNSLSIAGTASQTRIESAATEKLVLTSGALLNTVANVFTVNAAGTAGIPLGIQTAELQTGSSNARELNVFTTSGDLAIGAKVTTTGGLTKSGAANLYLTNAANTYTGNTTINAGSLVIDDKAALGGSTTLQIGGGFLKYRGTDTTLSGISIVAAGGEAANPNGGSAGFNVVSGITLTAASGSVSGYGGVFKDGTGVLKLTGTNTNSGATIIAGGALAIDGAAALGTNGRIIFADGLSTAGGQTLRFDANNITLTQDFITNTAAANVGFGFDTNGNNATLSGPLLSTTSARGLYKFGAGELNLTATQMYIGATQIFGGTLKLSGSNGSIVSSSATGGFSTLATVFINPGAALVLDNATTNNNNRLPDVWDTPFGTGNGASGKLLMNGGEFKIIGNAAGTQEKINQFDINAGTITLSGGGTSVVSGRFNRTVQSSAGLIRGTNLGATPSATSTNWFVTDLGSGGVQLAGAGGAEATPFINILPGFVADASATGTGTDLVTYAADTGFRRLASNEYTSTIPTNNFYSSRAPNIAVTGAATVGQTTVINAIKLGSGASVSGSGTLVLFNSTILATGNASISTPMLSTNISGGNTPFIFHTSGSGTTITVDSVLQGGSIVKYGDGTLLLNQRAIANAGLIIYQGTVKFGANGAIAPTGGIVVIQPGATLDLNGSDRTIGNLLTTTAIGTYNMGQVSDGTVALGANRLTLYDSNNLVFTGSVTGTGGLTKAFVSTGTTTFTQPLAYTGSTVIRGGTIELASAGTLASTAIEIRGGALQFTNSDDNAAVGGYVANRIGTSVPVTLAGGIAFTENANAPANHNLGAVTLVGDGTLAITQTSVTAPSTTTIANLIHNSSNTGTITITATNLGLAQSPVGNARVFATQINGAAPASALIGAGGAVGTTTQSILPWAWSSTTSFLSYGTNGFRPLTTAEYSATLGASATDNVRTTAGVVLSATTTANSLLHTSTAAISGAFDLTLTSGALAVTSAATIGVNTNALLTGASNTRELLINNTAATSLNYKLTTSGGVTKFGTGTLTLGGTNTFTGGLAINAGQVNFSNNNQLGTTGGAIRLGGTAANPATLAYTGSTTLAFDRSVETTALGNFTGVANVRWQFNQPITGAGGVRYTTANAIFELNATNTYTGPTQLTSGIVYATGDSAFGNGGEILFGGGTLVQLGDWTTSRLINSTTPGRMNTNGYDTTLNGQLLGVNFSKTGNGNLILTEAMPYNGVFAVFGGTLVLKDRGSLAVSFIQSVSPGAAITLDDRSTHFSDRLNDTGNQVNLIGGSLNLLGNASTTTEEVFNTLSLGVGANTVSVTPGSGQAAIMRLANSSTNNAGAATLFRGTNLGVNAPGTADSANILLTDVAKQTANAFAVTGGGAPAGNPSISIIKGSFGDTSATGLGTQLVTYDLDKGVRLLNPTTEYTTTLVNGSVVTDNVKADGSAINLTAATTANAVWLKDGGSITGGGTLTLTAATLLVTGTGNTVTGVLANGTNVFAIGGPGNVTFNTANGITGSAGLVKMGAGSVTFGANNTYTGNTILTAGIVNITTATPFGTTAVQFQDGEIRNTSAALITLANDLTLNGTMRVGGAQDLTFSGTVNLNNATRTVDVTNTGTTTISGVISSSTTLVNFGLTKTGTGLLVLSNAANTYDGPTTISGGTLSIGTLANGGINSSIGKGFADADRLVLDGGTLKYTGPTVSTDRLFTLTPNGGILDASGSGNLTLTNTGSIAATGSGTRTLALTGLAARSNSFAPIITNGPTAADKTSVAVSQTNWTFSNANTYTGNTTVSSGTLLLTGSGSIANSPLILLSTAAATLNISGVTSGANFSSGSFALASGQTLAGNGTVTGSVRVLSGAVLSPGLLVTNSAPGTMTVNGTTPTVTLAAGSNFAFYQNTALTPSTASSGTGGSGTTGTINNLLSVSGTFAVADPTNLTVVLHGDANLFSPSVPYSFRLVTASNTITSFSITNQAKFDTSAFSNFYGQFAFTLQGSGTSVYLDLTPTPEPGAILAIAAGVLGVSGSIRRRRFNRKVN